MPRENLINRKRTAKSKGAKDTRNMAALLLDWFRRSARDLPWRRTSDPYAIWVSEIMLQQTQVKTVIPYWNRWMKTFPTVSSLARADQEKVLKMWEGLGYYRRARSLHQAATKLVEENQGQFPEGVEEILDLPGIGRYTAGAVASIAFNQPAPILDGNVMRVLARLHVIKGSVQESSTQKRLWSLAEELVLAASQLGSKTKGPRQSPFHNIPKCSHLNQSLMELGALVCLPRQPECNVCPVKPYCQAHLSDRVADYPNVAPRPKSIPRRFVAYLLKNRNRYLIRQRSAENINGSLWEFPNLEITLQKDRLAKLTEPKHLDRIAALAHSELNLLPKQLVHAMTVRHSITKYRIQLDAFHGRCQSNQQGKVKAAAKSKFRWVDLEELMRLPFTSAHRRLADWIQRTEA